ncbi:hypothetical protein PHYPSEUDO_005208 [Phytophthora pseudosyringae]|uniref:Uncharacterized protein n=1 Tax=Phytophthora pseudosyringae TaxID=221518 RepID=A0A8T1VLI6_9STRA|nr:hypothetical protein PHYPSEUDO_005208 [Phytophthora pseudosyringae]
MDALGNIANDGDAKRAIVAEGAIPLLVRVRQEGTETQRGFAASLRAQANIPKSYAAFALGCVAANSDEYSTVIAQAGGIRRLVPLLRTGTDAQKAHAATALGWLANLDENRLEMARKGAVAYLVALVGGGTQEQKENAAFALSFLAMDVASGVAMVNDGVISPLVALLRAGTEGQKEHAVCTLGNLAGSQENCLSIAREGGIRPLVGLLRAGNTAQQGLAALTLGCIGTSNEVNRLAIVSDEVLDLLVGLIRSSSGAEEPRDVRALLSHQARSLRCQSDSERGRGLSADPISSLRNG